MSLDDGHADDSSMVILVVDEAGAASTLADTCRKAGHHVMTATGIDTAVCVIGGLTPDLVLIRAVGEAEDRAALATLQGQCPEVPARVVETPVMFSGMGAGESSSLN